MTPSGILIVITTLLTVVSVGAEILIRAFGRIGLSETGWDIRCCFTQAVGIYFVVALGCNIVGANLASYYLETQHSAFVDRQGNLVYFLSAFAGVFVLGLVFTNTNVSLFNKGVFVFQDWVTQARDPAVVSAINKQALLKRILQDKLKEEIRALPSDELQIDLLNHLGQDELQKLEQDATAANIDNSELYKVMRLVELHPTEAMVLSKRARRRRQRQRR